jgi:DNA adenine methylase
MPGASHPDKLSLARPFLKWAGGKGQLLPQLAAYFPPGLANGEIKRYVEPFIGSGAVFLYVIQRFAIDQVHLSDLNPELILLYRSIQQDVEGVVASLGELQASYLELDEPDREAFFYQMRSQYNADGPTFDYERPSPAWVVRTTQALFLNRTGYNGLFRVNRRGEFNVPFGRYKNPRLADPANLRAVARLLQGVRLEYGDFEQVGAWIDGQTFVYFDPPYRPLSRTASFTHYAREAFNDDQQRRLAHFYRQLDARGACLMLSNSDPQGLQPGDDFFQEAYAGFRIERLQASRNINSNPQRRGPVSELLILNY